MNPEEFDNRLKSSFQDEYLPPKDQLWQNINHRLNMKAKRPFWHWLVPAIIVTAAGLAWLGSGISSPEQSNENTAVVEPISTPHTDAVNPVDNSVKKTDVPDVHENVKENIQETDKNESPKNIIKSDVERAKVAERQISSPSVVNTPDKTSKNDYHKAKEGTSNTTDNEGSKTGSNTSVTNTEQAIANTNNTNNTNNTQVSERSGSINNTAFDKQISETFRLSMSPYPYFYPKYILDKEALLAFEKADNPKKPETREIYRRKYNSEAFDSKWWFEIGMGPQLALNSMRVKNDSQSYIHKDLWKNRAKATGNGTGFQAHTSLLYKFGKNNRFAFEFGLNFSQRTEEIKMNESTYDIEHRQESGPDSGKIDFYLRFLVYIPQGGDTTWFDATQAFTLFQKNKYQVYTIPLRFQSEHKVSENTYMSLGLGAGFSMIYSRSATHMNLVSEQNVTAIKKKQFSASLNASLAFFTNFNDVGQIGIYTGFQTYMQPWKVNNGQYAIKMSDIQFGLMFRKPLNWGK